MKQTNTTNKEDMVMSKQKVFTAFMEKMATDDDFAAKVNALQTPADLIALANTLGVTLSDEQAQAGLACVQKLAEGDGVLADDDLEEVAGGVSQTCYNIPEKDWPDNANGC